MKFKSKIVDCMYIHVCMYICNMHVRVYYYICTCSSIINPERGTSGRDYVGT